ncbi:MAG: DUF1925 domain-containing protein [Clostridia bacterium]|nr:DUF1925 domain-containing protein [Clostridia bacterium]
MLILEGKALKLLWAKCRQKYWHILFGGINLFLKMKK